MRGLLKVVMLSLVAFVGLASGALRNPFRGKQNDDFYINPINYRRYEQSLGTANGEIKERLKQMQSVPSAYWIDVKEKIKAKGTPYDLRTLEGILQDAASKPQPQLCVFVWYDLPNRDCKGQASNAQICCNKNADGSCNYRRGGDCVEGIREYKEEYVDPFIAVLRDFQNRVPIVIVVEPNSLPSLVTNVVHPRCGSSATRRAYTEGISYSLHQLARETPRVTVYLDAAHGGLMGWENYVENFMHVLKDMNLPKIRGFATNVANYQPLGIQCPWHADQAFRNGYCLNGRHQNDPCCKDPCGLSSQWNFGNNELNYAAGLLAAADQLLGWDARVVIDTGRNGVVDHGSKCGNWCNPRGAGAGVKSTAATSNASLVDAYFWLKTPGESDGCTETLPGGGRCPHFDVQCGSEDSLGSRPGEPRSPEAGHWFDHQVKELAANANFKLPSKTAGQEEGFSPPIKGPEVETDGVGGDPHSIITTTRKADRNGGHDNDDVKNGTCSHAFGQCGGSNWTGPTCCQTGCRCRHESDGHSQCEPPAGKQMCASSHKGPVDEEHGTGAPQLFMAGVPLLTVLAVSVMVAKVVRQHRQPSSDLEKGGTKPMVLHDDDVEGVE